MRLSSIVSQPKKIVVVVVVVIVVVVVLIVVGLDVIIVGHRNLTLKFGQNWANNSRDIVIVGPEHVHVHYQDSWYWS